jgi:xanthine dehydrogenase YagR molybdenum-binding subunit
MAGWKKPSENKILGKSYTRLDGPIKATGQAKYAYDINLPGLLFGRIFRSQKAHAVIKSIDISAAEKMPGVKAVILIPVPGGKVRYQGQELGALCATSSDIAEDAIRAIKVEYEILPHAVHEQVALRPNAPKVMDRDTNTRQMQANTRGDVDAAFRSAAVVSEGTYNVAARAHLCLETHGVTCRWDDADHLTCWASTQGIFTVLGELAGHFKIPATNINVITEVMGGGFGSKFGAGYEGIRCAELAKKTNAPVKLLLTREEEHLGVGHAPSTMGTIKIGADKEGKITAFDAHVYRCGGVAEEGGPMPYIYDQIDAQRVVQDALYINGGPSAAWRAPAHPQSSFLMECAVEDLAVKMGMDPLEFRLKNDHNELRHLEWHEGAKLIGWDRRNLKPGVGTLAGTGRYKRGLGCGAASWGGRGYPGTKVRVAINRDGSVLVENGVQDIGTGTRTYMGAIVAEELGLPREAITVSIGHSSMGPGPASGGSVTTPSLAPAVKQAAEKAKAALLEAVASKRNLKGEDLDMADGKVFLKADPSKNGTFKQACSALPTAGISVEGQWDAKLQQDRVAGCQFAEVEVDTETGHVKVVKVVAIQDGGIILNKLTFESQVNGAIIQGIGMALLEDRHMCQLTGRMTNPNMEEYKVPGPMEMPEFVAIAFENPKATGVSGIGEPPVIPTAAAIRNAILNASGAHVNEAPMNPGRILAALAAARKGGMSA